MLSERQRNFEEARAEAARLDGEADQVAASAFRVAMALWLGIGGAVLAGWYRLT